MNGLVADASRVANAVLPDERQPYTEQLLDVLINAQLVEPAHWPIEVTGALLRAARRGRLTADERTRAKDMIEALVKTAEVETQSRAFSAFDLAVQHNISVYDATYLELAVRAGLPLLTSDGPLARAAEIANVELIVFA